MTYCVEPLARNQTAFVNTVQEASMQFAHILGLTEPLLILYWICLIAVVILRWRG